MARVAGINIPDNKHAEILLTYVYGIGKTTAKNICLKVGIEPSIKIADLNEEELESGQETTESENSSGPKTAEIPALQSYSSPTESKEPS